jgi:hypothetical protein
MPAEQIVALLIAERDRLNRAIEALGGTVGKRRGRPPKSASAAPAPKKKRGRVFTAAQRKAQAERMRKLWAERRKGKKSAA